MVDPFVWEFMGILPFILLGSVVGIMLCLQSGDNDD